MVFQIKLELTDKDFRQTGIRGDFFEMKSPTFIASPDDIIHRWNVCLNQSFTFPQIYHVFISTTKTIGTEPPFINFHWKAFDCNNELILEKNNDGIFSKLDKISSYIQYTAPKIIKRICVDLKLSREEPINPQVMENPSSKEEFEVEMLHQKSTNKVSEDLLSLYESKEFSDITIECGDREFEVHKQILVSRSSVFRTLLKNNMKESISKTISISDIDPEAMSEFLKFLYSGNVKISKEIVFDILDLGEKYDVQDLKDLCEVEMRDNIEVASAVSFLITADKYGMNELKVIALKFIKEHRQEVMKNDSWKLMRNHFDLINELLV